MKIPWPPTLSPDLHPIHPTAWHPPIYRSMDSPLTAYRKGEASRAWLTFRLAESIPSSQTAGVRAPAGLPSLPATSCFHFLSWQTEPRKACPRRFHESWEWARTQPVHQTVPGTRRNPVNASCFCDMRNSRKDICAGVKTDIKICPGYRVIYANVFTPMDESLYKEGEEI